MLFYLIKGRRTKALMDEAIRRSIEDGPGGQRQCHLYRLSNLIASEGERQVSDLSIRTAVRLETWETGVMAGNLEISLWAGPATPAPQPMRPEKRLKPCSASSNLRKDGSYRWVN